MSTLPANPVMIFTGFIFRLFVVMSEKIFWHIQRLLVLILRMSIDFAYQHGGVYYD